MNKHVLITGATGMIGKKLTSVLLEKGYQVSILSRKSVALKNVNVFLWDVYRQEIDPKCLDGVTDIIHLAGEGIADKKWTAERKKVIIDSRVQSAQLLYQLIKETNTPIQSFISASAVGYYGDCGDEILNEASENGYGFLAESCKQWETAVDQGKSLNLRIVKLRLGVVLAKQGGALASMDKPIRFFVGTGLGTGKQWVPWVHIEDITAMFIQALENQQMMGAYNACAPHPVTNLTLTKAIAKKLHRPVWPFNVPESVLKLILGELSIVALISNNTSAQKLLDTGFKFKYIQLDHALTDIYRS